MHVLEQQFTPNVPALIRNQATQVEAYLLDQNDVLRQQNEALISALISVETQTKLTNGRVSAHDKKIEALEGRSVAWDAVNDRLKSYGRRLAIGLTIVGPVLLAIFNRVIAHYWP